jgi:hydrogenase maturation protease
MAKIIIGVGNPVLADDSVGLKVVQRVAELLPPRSGVVVRELHVGGIHLMEAMTGYDEAIIVDAMSSPRGVPGTVYLPAVECLFNTRNTRSTQDSNLAEALELGKRAGVHLPARIRIWAVEAADVTSFGEQLSEAVQRSVPLVVDHILDELAEEQSAEEQASDAKPGACA